MDSIRIETSVPLTSDISLVPPAQTEISPKAKSIPPPAFKDRIRTSLRASTIDAVFAVIFSLATSGILLSNFLVELDANPVAFGMLSSIPMLVNLIQPLGAYLSERSTSRFRYAVSIYTPSRLLWLILTLGIFATCSGLINSHQLIVLTLAIVLFSNLFAGLGGASWLAWLAVIVPRRLRGRYFGFRSSVSSFTNLLCVPLAGFAVSNFPGGHIKGYGVILLIGILSGIISLVCQYFKIDINPQEQHLPSTEGKKGQQTQISVNPPLKFFQDTNFLIFILYFSLWMFGVNLSAPFFNLYMLDALNLDVSWVTLYSSIQAGANLLALMVWGQLADRIGNRPILLIVGVLVAVTPVFWLGVSSDPIDLWLWLPLLHVLAGATWAAIDLCINNLQLGVAPVKNQSTYFAIAAAVSGLSGALGTTIGGFLAGSTLYGGLPGLFVLSGVFRLFGLIPLLFVCERGKKLFNLILQREF